MYRRCTTEEASARQKQLEDQLFQAMLQKPYNEISVSDLCDQAGISRKSFYRYFGNKDGCLNALLDRVLLGTASYSAAVDYSAGMKSQELLEIMAYWADKKSLLDVITRNNLQAKFLERSMQHIIQEERETLRWLGVCDINEDPETLIFTVTGFLAVLLEWSRTDFPRTTAEMAEILTRIWTRPLMCPPESR